MPKSKPVYLSSSSTLINLGCTGHPRRGLRVGKFYHYIGDSETGKTTFILSVFAEACRNANFDDYDFYFEDSEDGSEDMDLDRMYGKQLRKRLQPLKGTVKNPDQCGTLEEFYDLAEQRLKAGPCILALDSLDALESGEEARKRGEDKAARESGKEIKGTFGQGKSRTNSSRLRILKNLCKKNKSILIIISQTRTAFGGFAEKTYSGGLALRFYAHVQIWTNLMKTLKKKVGIHDKQVGAITRFRFRKNRSSGWKGSVDIPFYWNYGFDDIGSMLSWLVAEGGWKKSGGKITPVDFPKLKPMKMNEMIEAVEEKNLERKLQDHVRACWKRVQKKLSPKRKPRFR